MRWASPSGREAFLPPPVWLPGSNGLALSSYFQFKLLTAEQHPVVLQPTRCLNIFYLSYLIVWDNNFVPSVQFAKQKQLFWSALVYSPISNSAPCLRSDFILSEPLRCWSPNHEIAQWVLPSTANRWNRKPTAITHLSPREGRRKGKIKN